MLDDHVAVNRAAWDLDAPNWVESGRRAWATGEPTWGIWGVPETELKLLPDATGLDVVELGCGTGYISAWLARRGGRCIGLDNSAKQLDTARMLQREFDLPFPLVHAESARSDVRQPSAGGSIAARTKLITSRSRRFSEARPLSAPTTTFSTLASVSEPTTPV